MKAQKEYLQNMSHDIRTPMNAICGFSQILCNKQIRDMLSEEEISEYGVIIQSNTDLLSTLVNDILDISDMESGKYRMNIGTCNVNDVCRKAISTVKYRCPAGVNLYMTTDVDDDYTIESDSKRVEQVVMNYLTTVSRSPMRICAVFAVNPNVPVVRKEVKVGRNDPCPCGSGKKYKKCCGRGK